MDQSTSVPTSAGEQNLTPGEQRILALMEQGHQRIEQRFERIEQRFERIEQRMDSMEQRMDSMEKQLEDLTIKVEQEIGASKMRDRQLAIDIQSVRQEVQYREGRLLAHIDHQVDVLRKAFNERFDQLDTRLGVVEQVVQLNRESA